MSLASRKRYRESFRGKATMRRYKLSSKGRAAIRRYNRSVYARAARSRYYSKPEVQEHRKWLQASRAKSLTILRVAI